MAAGNSTVLRYVLVSSLLLNLLCGGYLVQRYLAKRSQRAYVPPPQRDYYLNRHELFNVLPADSGAVVFLGNSLTQYFEVAEFFPDQKVKNRGIHGDQLGKLLQRLRPIAALRPAKIFIEIGINDVEQKVPTDTVLHMYSRLLDSLKSNCPQSQLYVQSLLPVADTSVYLPSYCSPAVNKTVVNVNSALQNLSAQKNCVYVDVHSRLLQNGQLHPAYSVDGVHLSGEGYKAWADVLRPLVAD